MNEGLRLLRRTLRRFGYDVRKIHDYDFMKVRNIDRVEGYRNLQLVKEIFDSAKNETGSEEPNNLCIRVRTCIRGNPDAPSGRITGATTHDNVLACLASVVESINYAVERLGSESFEIVVLDDHSNEISVKAMKRTLGALRSKWSFKTSKSISDLG